MRMSSLVPFLAILVAPTFIAAEDQPAATTVVPAAPAPSASGTTAAPAAKETNVVVTADRRQTDATRSTASVSRVDAQDDRERGYVLNSWQWLQNLPGVDAVSANGSIDGGLGRVRIRGANSFDTQWMVDGIPVSDPSTPQGSLSTNVLPSAGLESVEVVRGAQSGLYGNRAVGGVVNLITARPTAEHEALVRAEAGSYGTMRAVAQGSGPIAKDLGYALAVDGMHSDGFSALTDSDAHGDAGSHEADSVDRLGANGRAEWQVIPTTSLYVAARYLALNQEFDGYLAPDSAVPFSQVRSTGLSAGSRSRMSERLTFDVDLSWMTSERTYRTSGVTIYDGDQRRVGVVARYQLVSWLEAALGGDASRDEFVTKTTTSETAYHDSLGGGWGQLYSTSAYHDVSVSLRQDLHSRAGDATTWRTAAAVHPLPQQLTVRGAVGTAFRAPSLSEQYGFGGNPELEAQKSLSYEAGIRIQPIREIAFESTYFVNDYDQLIGFSNSQSAYANVSDYRNHGLENALEFEGLNRHMTVRAAYTWQEVVSVPADVDDSFTPYQPNHLASIAATLRGAPGWARIGFTRRGATPASIYDATTRTEWASVVDVAVGANLNKIWEISARIDNVFDEAYEVTPGYATSGIAAYGGVAARF